MASEQQLSDVLSEFARTMLTDFPIQTILNHLVERIVELLPVSGAGVTLISPGIDPRYVAASDMSALRYEQLQTEVGEGPCVLAYETGEPVSVPDLQLEDRFPRFVERALEVGLAAVFTFPLGIGHDRLGALDLYRDEPGPLDARAMQQAQTLADVAAAYLVNAQARDALWDASELSRKASLRDGLTGLPNRLLLMARIEHAMLRASRSEKMAAVLFVDLDRFKVVNDTHGHQIGDELLVAVAHRLRALLRPGDTLARLSGDEFVILCEDIEEKSQVDTIAARIGASFTAPFHLSRTDVEISASVGIAFAGRGDSIPEELIHDADSAMYQAKGKGGARHQIIDLREQHLTEQRASLQRDLGGAWTRGEMRAEYQPIVTTVDGRITGVEALARWAHPTRGLIPPATLIPLAERCGAIIDIGQWMLERACPDRDRLQSHYQTDHLEMSVNVSTEQIMSPTFAATVDSVLRATDTDPAWLTLEVTEGVFVQDSERALVVLNDLKRLGVMLALDDFGTGYSSLSYLKEFPVDIVKIDRTFVNDLAEDTASHAIVAAVVDLSHVLGMTVVAEGVETAQQHQKVADLGCDSCQGFYFARPMTADALDTLMDDLEATDTLRLPAYTPASAA